MKKDDIMWKCPYCGRIIPDMSYIIRKDHGQCPCGAWYWELNMFMLDKDDEITVDLETAVEKTIEQLIEGAYRDGYSRGFEAGDEHGYADGYDEGYKDNKGPREI